MHHPESQKMKQLFLNEMGVTVSGSWEEGFWRMSEILQELFWMQHLWSWEPLALQKTSRNKATANRESPVWRKNPDRKKKFKRRKLSFHLNYSYPMPLFAPTRAPIGPAVHPRHSSENGSITEESSLVPGIDFTDYSGLERSLSVSRARLTNLHF